MCRSGERSGARGAGVLVLALSTWAVAAPAMSQTRGVEAPQLAGEPLRLAGEPLSFPVTTMDGAVATTRSRVTVQADVLFAFGSARLTSGARGAVADAARALADARTRSARVVGYTDDVGSAGANLRLSRRRAAGVRRALLARLGRAAPPLTAEGRGERDPVAANAIDSRDSPRGRARNRRVELVVR